MNRAMGFGVLTGTMLGTTALTAMPVSAHDPVQETRGAGGVRIILNHTEMAVWDESCSDGTTVQGQLKVNPEAPIIRSLLAPCNDIDLLDVPAVTYAFRKCLLGSGSFGCNQWAPI
jgi:hypothetical protein